MSELDSIIASYSSFEIRVRKMLTAFCNPYCRVCTNLCCKPYFCKESISTPFLSLIREHFPPLLPYNESSGWLTETGCVLSVGRPPICYEFICDRIADEQPDLLHEYVLKVLSRLVSHLGKNAAGKCHLVEIVSSDEFSRISYSRFRKRLFEAENAFSAILSFFGNGKATNEMISALAKIVPKPKTIVL